MKKQTRQVILAGITLAMAIGTQAAGFAKYDGVDGESKDNRQHKPVQIQKKAIRSTPRPRPGNIKNGASKPPAIGMLLPAVQE